MAKFLLIFILVFTVAFGFIYFTGSIIDRLISNSMGIFFPLVVITAAGSWFLISHIDTIAKEVGENDKLNKPKKLKLQSKFRELKDEVLSNVKALIALLILEQVSSFILAEIEQLDFDYIQFVFIGIQAFRISCLIMAFFIVWIQLSSFKQINQYREVISS
jgi:small-conductance mechanosensitive channel